MLRLAVELISWLHWSVWAIAIIAVGVAAILRRTRYRQLAEDGVLLLWSFGVVAHVPLVHYSGNAKFDLSPLSLAHACGARTVLSIACAGALSIVGVLGEPGWASMRRVFLTEVLVGAVGVLAIARVFASSLHEARDALLFAAIAVPVGDIVAIAVAAVSIGQRPRT
ncbi:MAG: hypothetical protein QUV05_20880 [Phycisphaerae bacterium]|nr:hypothetical protein [Phycisphaerae bacterium]